MGSVRQSPRAPEIGLFHAKSLIRRPEAKFFFAPPLRASAHLPNRADTYQKWVAPEAGDWGLAARRRGMGLEGLAHGAEYSRSFEQVCTFWRQQRPSTF